MNEQHLRNLSTTKPFQILSLVEILLISQMKISFFCQKDISRRTKKLKKPLVKNKKPCYNNFCQLMPNGVTVAPVTLDHLV